MITDHFVDCARNADGVAGDLGLVGGKLIWRRRGRGSKALEGGPVPGLALALESGPVSSMVLALEAGPVPSLVLALEAGPVPRQGVEVAARYL